MWLKLVKSIPFFFIIIGILIYSYVQVLRNALSRRGKLVINKSQHYFAITSIIKL